MFQILNYEVEIRSKVIIDWSHKLTNNEVGQNDTSTLIGIENRGILNLELLKDNVRRVFRQNCLQASLKLIYFNPYLLSVSIKNISLIILID